MKKSIIKRRKRVVAPHNGPASSPRVQATPVPPPTQQSPGSGGTTHTALQQLAQSMSSVVTAQDDDTEMSDGTNTAGTNGGHMDQLTSPGPGIGVRHYPIPVDYTSFRSTQSSNLFGGGAPVATMTSSSSLHSYHTENTTLAPLQGGSGSPPHGMTQLSSLSLNSRKRSLSVSSGGDHEDNLLGQRINSINSLLNPRSQSSAEVPIEPSLLAMSAASAAAAAEEEQRANLLKEKRLRLEQKQKRLREEMEREQKRLREAMEACEKELAGLSDPENPNGGMLEGQYDASTQSLIRAIQESGSAEHDMNGGGSGSNLAASDLQPDAMVLT